MEIDNVGVKYEEFGKGDREENKKRKQKKCLKCCGICVLLTAVLLVIIYLILNFSIVPSLAQSSVNYTIMDLINGSISNPTNTSVFMSSNIKISNSGFFFCFFV